MRWRADLAARPEQLGDALCGAGGALQFADHLAEGAEGHADDQAVEDERGQFAGRDAAGDHVAAADPEHDADRAEHQHDHHGDQPGALGDALARGVEGAFDGAGEALAILRLVVVGLHGLDLTEGFTDVAADVGHPVLAFPRQAAHAAAEQQDRGDHQRQRQHHDAGQLGVGDEHQQHPADQHQGIAQGHRQRGTDHRLQQRSVGGQARLDLGATVGFVETGMQLDQVVEHALADIGDEALADPGHQVEAHEGAHGQAEHQHEEQQDVAIEQFGRGGEEPLVHQQADALAQGQGDRRGEQQRHQGPEHAPAVRRHEAPGQAQGDTLAGGENGWHAALARRLGFRRLAPGTQRGDACPGRQRDDIDVYIRAT